MLESNQRVSPAHKMFHLSHMPLFQGLAQHDLDELNRITTVRQIRKGHIFYRPEEASDAIFILQKGHADVYRINTEGRKLIVATLGANALFDDVALSTSGPHQNFAEATEDCVVFVINHAALKHFILKNPRIIVRILDSTSKRLHRVEAKLESFAFSGLAVRLSELLLRLSEEHGNNKIIGSWLNVWGYTEQSHR